MACPASPNMEYNYLGNSGLKVSNICLGTMTMGSSSAGHALFRSARQTDETASHALMDKFAEHGGNFIDTADFYSTGNSEEIIGTWLGKRERDRYIIATKVRFGWDKEDPNGTGLSRKRIMSCIDNSLKRLKTDYVDLYQIHCWDKGVPLKETLLALNDLVRCGKVRYVGASNLSGWQQQKIVDLCDRMGFSPFVSLQQQYNLLTRENEFEVFDVCENEGIGILPWSPLKGGLLTGKYKKGTKADSDTRMGWGQSSNVFSDYQTIFESEKFWKISDCLQETAKETGKTVPQVSLRWLLQKKIVSSVIVGATKMSQLEDNMGAATGWTLSDEQMKKLDEVSAPALPYPYNMIKSANMGR